MSCYREIKNNTGRCWLGKPHRRELLRASKRAGLGEHTSAAANLPVEVATENRLAFLAKAACPLLDDGAVDLRHTRGGCARPCRKRKDMQLRKSALVDQIERAGEHVFVLGRKAGDDVSAEGNVGPQLPDLFAEGNRVATRMPPFHASENEIVPGLQGQVQMRHQPWLVGKRVAKIVIGFDRVDRGQP